MKCKICGYDISQDRSYCPMCGTPVEAGAFSSKNDTFKGIDSSTSVRGRSDEADFNWNTVDFPKPKAPQDINMRWTMSSLKDDATKPVSVMSDDASEGYVRTGMPETPASKPVRETVAQQPAYEAPASQPQQTSQPQQAPMGTWQMPIWYTQPIGIGEFPQRFTASGYINIEPQPMQSAPVAPAPAQAPATSATSSFFAPDQSDNAAKATVYSSRFSFGAPYETKSVNTAAPAAAPVTPAPAPVSRETMPRGVDDAWLDEQLAKAHEAAPAEQFPTFVKKNEEFQQLLNKEYERVSSLNAVPADSEQPEALRRTHTDLYGQNDVVQASDLSDFEKMLMEGTKEESADDTIILNRERKPVIIKDEPETAEDKPLAATQVISPVAVAAAAAAATVAKVTAADAPEEKKDENAAALAEEAAAVEEAIRQLNASLAPKAQAEEPAKADVAEPAVAEPAKAEPEAPAKEELAPAKEEPAAEEPAPAAAPQQEETKEPAPAKAAEDPLAKMPKGDISWSKMLEEMEAEKIAAASNKKATAAGAAVAAVAGVAAAAAKQADASAAHEKAAEPEKPAEPVKETKVEEPTREFTLTDILAQSPAQEDEKGLPEVKKITKRITETLNKDTIEMKLAELRRREKAEESLRSERRKKLDDMAKARDEFFGAMDESTPVVEKTEDVAAPVRTVPTVVEEDFLKPRKSHGFLTFILILLIIAGLLYGGVWAVNKFAPDSIASDIANQFSNAAVELVDKGVDKANQIISFYTGKTITKTNDKQEELDTSTLGEDEEFNFKAIVSSADPDSLIKKITLSSKLKPESFSGTSLEDAEVVKDDKIREAIYRTMVGYNASWVLFVNEGNSKCLEFLKSDGAAYKNAVKYDKIGEITETFESLELGEIRYDGEYYYICESENITIEQNDGKAEKSVSVSEMVYRIAPVEKTYKIVDYAQVDKAKKEE